MIDRSHFTPDGSNPPEPVFVTDTCTVPTEQMAHLLADLLGDAKDVLEIGTGSGYQTAILADRFRSVVSIEFDPQPGLDKKLPNNVALIIGNGYTYSTGEEFDAVLVTFGTHHVDDLWASQVKDGGRLVVPLYIGQSCRISVYERRGTVMQLIDAAAYASFTPGATS